MILIKMNDHMIKTKLEEKKTSTGLMISDDDDGKKFLISNDNC